MMYKNNMLTHAKKQRALQSLQSGRFLEAKALLEEIVRIDRTDIDSWMNLAIVNSQTGSVGEVERCCRQAIALRPGIVEAHFNLGAALYIQGKTTEAAQCYRQTLKLKPDHILALFNLGKALHVDVQLEEALDCFERALRAKPKPSDNLPGDFRSTVHHAIASVLKALGRMEEAVEQYHEALRLNPRLTKAHSDLLLALNYHATDPAVIFNEHVRWGKNNNPGNIPAEPYGNTPDPDRPLRIGYVSPDMYKHAVTFFFEPLLAAHDRSTIVPVCYAQAWKQDETTERLRSLSALWRNTCEMSDEQLARQIRADGIDILVDLAGHTANSRLTVFFRKPAPIQVTYLGYPNTTGIDAIDYRLTDAWADPPGLTDRFYTEKLVRLPHGFLCYQPQHGSPGIGPLPSADTGYVTFGSFNNQSKITSGVIAVWSAILQAVPDSRLILKNISLKDPSTQKRVRREFMRHGVSGSRLDLRGPIWHVVDHQSVYNQVDIALDPFPYNGTTTTYEALWMGVPVIVLAGDMHAGRVGVSILTQLGLADFIANSTEDYVRLAAALAGNPQRLSQLRATLRNTMAASTLCDAGRFARDVEAAYRMMWRQWCADSEPGHRQPLQHG